MSCNCKKLVTNYPHYHHHHHHNPNIGFDSCYEDDDCPRHCDCFHDVNSLCVVYKGEDLENLGVKRCSRLEDILNHLDKLWMNKFFNNHPIFTGKNLGSGKGIYKGITSDGEEGFKSINDSTHIIFTEDGETIQANINLEWLNKYIVQTKHERMGGGTPTVHIENNTIKHRGITSRDSSLIINLENDGALNIGVNYKDIRSYLSQTNKLYDIYVDTSLREGGDGTIVNPFSSFSEAYNYIIGLGTDDNPDLKNRRIILLSDTNIYGNPYINTTELSLRNVNVNIVSDYSKASCISIVKGNKDQIFRITGEGSITSEEKKPLINLVSSKKGKVELLIEGDITLNGEVDIPLISLEGIRSKLKSKGTLSIYNNKGTFIYVDKATLEYEKLILFSNTSIINPIILLENAVVKGGIIEVDYYKDDNIEWNVFYEVLSPSIVDTSYYINSNIIINNFIKLGKETRDFTIGSYRNESYINTPVNNFIHTRDKEVKLNKIRCVLESDKIKQYTNDHYKSRVTINSND